MTDKPNTLQVVSRELLERLHGWLTHIHHFRVADMADLEAALKEAPALGSEPEGPLCFCGQRQTKNPHPDAGVPPGYLEVGTVYDCIPCLNKSRRAWSKRANAAESRVTDLQGRVTELESVMRDIRGANAAYALTKIDAALRPTEGAQS